MDKFKLVMDGFWGGFLLGLIAIPGIKYVGERFGGPIWQDIKKSAYKIWEIVKAPFVK